VIKAGQDPKSQTCKVPPSMVDGVWSSEGEGGMRKRMNQDKIC